MLSFSTNIKGFSLIELLITIALIGFLAFMALPMTAAWIDGPDVTKGSTLLQQAFAKAKNIAIREGATLGANEAAAVVCATTTDDVITVKVKSQTGAVGDAGRTRPNCTNQGNEVFSAKLPRKVTFKLGANDVTCACFGSGGEIINAASASCDACVAPATVNTTKFTITKGGESENVALY